jgi:hypothetical protein
MDEAFDCLYNGKNTKDYGRFYNQWAETDMKDFVSRDRNHPSVIIWSIVNEVGESGDKTAIQKMMDAIHAKDTTRPITQAYAAWVGVESITGIEDLVGINYAVQDVRQRVVIRAAQPGHLQRPGHPVLFLRRPDRRLGANRGDLVEQGEQQGLDRGRVHLGRVHEGKDSGKEAQVVITRSKPLEVMVGFDRYLVDRSGTATESGHVFLRAHLKEVPRSPGDPSGLLIVDTEISERL